MGKGMIYTYIDVGLSTLLVSTNRAMRRPLHRGTSNKVRLHVFFIVLFLLWGWRGKKECIMIPILCPDCNREMKVRKVLDTHTALTMCPYCKKEFKISNEKQLFPSNINSFNWGAFTLFPIWCFWNGMPWLFFIYIVGFIPVVGVIITILVSFYLGFKGNKLSWEKKNWSSIQNFEFYQKQWGRAGLTVLVISIFAFIFSIIDIISRAHGYEF